MGGCTSNFAVPKLSLSALANIYIVGTLFYTVFVAISIADLFKDSEIDFENACFRVDLQALIDENSTASLYKFILLSFFYSPVLACYRLRVLIKQQPMTEIGGIILITIASFFNILLHVIQAYSNSSESILDQVLYYIVACVPSPFLPVFLNYINSSVTRLQSQICCIGTIVVSMLLYVSVQLGTYACLPENEITNQQNIILTFTNQALASVQFFIFIKICTAAWVSIRHPFQNTLVVRHPNTLSYSVDPDSGSSGDTNSGASSTKHTCTFGGDYGDNDNLNSEKPEFDQGDFKSQSHDRSRLSQHGNSINSLIRPLLDSHNTPSQSSATKQPSTNTDSSHWSEY